jgi:hypothetical protein
MLQMHGCACPANVAGAAQDAELALHLLKVLLAATSSQEARTAAHSHAAGMPAMLQLATSAARASWAAALDVPADAGAAAAPPQPAHALAAAAAADLLVQLGEEKQIKPLLAQPLAQVCCLQIAPILDVLATCSVSSFSPRLLRAL